MELFIERAAGVDVGQATVAATVLLGRAHERPCKERRSFRTLSRSLHETWEWFASLGVMTRHRPILAQASHGAGSKRCFLLPESEDRTGERCGPENPLVSPRLDQ